MTWFVYAFLTGLGGMNIVLGETGWSVLCFSAMGMLAVMEDGLSRLTGEDSE